MVWGFFQFAFVKKVKPRGSLFEGQRNYVTDKLLAGHLSYTISDDIIYYM